MSLSPSVEPPPCNSSATAACITLINSTILCSSPSFFSAPLARALLVFLAVDGLLYVDLRQDSENVGLKHGDKYLEPIEHYREGHRDDRHGGPEVQDQPEEDEDDQVPSQDVGVEPQPKREGLTELLYEVQEPKDRP